MVKYPFNWARLGKSAVLFFSSSFCRIQVSVTASLDRPFPDRPFEGQLGFFVEYSGVAIDLDGFSAVGTLQDEDQFGGMLQRVLERAFKTSRAVDLESLCVLTGQQVWNLRVDAHILSDDGNVMDALVLSVLAALIDFRRPDVQVSAEGEVTVFSAFERHPVPLTLHHFPISVSFSLFNEPSAMFVLDPVNQERLVQDSQISFIMNRQGEIIHLSKPGGKGVQIDFVLEQVLPVAKETAVKLSDLINSAVASRPSISVTKQ